MSQLLVDTSLWVDHFRRRVPRLEAHLRALEVMTHSAVLGALVVGGLAESNRRLLRWVPAVPALTDVDVLAFVDRQDLVGAGIGWVDCHLLAAVERHRDVLLWTRDRKLHECAAALGLAAETA